MKDFTTWCVVSPEYQVAPMGYDPPEPPEYGHDVLIVAADTAREARSAAVRLFRQQKAGYLRDYDNPFTGLEITEAVCRHGVHARPMTTLDPVWGADSETPPCPACDDEWDSYDHACCRAYEAGFYEV